jgi:hypothetical protein
MRRRWGGIDVTKNTHNILLRLVFLNCYFFFFLKENHKSCCCVYEEPAKKKRIEEEEVIEYSSISVNIFQPGG